MALILAILIFVFIALAIFAFLAAACDRWPSSAPKPRRKSRL
jgi:hypothetical protein